MIRQRTDSSFLRASIVAASVALGTLAVACGGEAPAPASPPSAPPAASAVAAGSATPAALPGPPLTAAGAAPRPPAPG